MASESYSIPFWDPHAAIDGVADSPRQATALETLETLETLDTLDTLDTLGTLAVRSTPSCTPRGLQATTHPCHLPSMAHKDHSDPKGLNDGHIDCDMGDMARPGALCRRP